MENFPLEFKRGETFSFSLFYVNNDGTPFTESTGSVTCQFTIKESYSDVSAAVTLNKGSGITYVGTASPGEFIVVIPSNATSTISWKKGVYDMWINSNLNGKDYVLDGTVTLLPPAG